jgi:fructose-specific phosphotransferase system IIC component
MTDWKDKIKEKVVEIIIAVIVIPLLSWIGIRLTQIYNSVKVVPEVQKNLNEFMTDLAENNKTYNSMLYYLNKKQREREIIDSLKNVK